MHFNVEGSLRSGVVNLHMIKVSDQADFEYKYLTLNVKGRATELSDRMVTETHR